MELIWHHNTWPWGKTVKIIKSDGSAIVEMAFEDNQPGVCFLSGLSVIEPQRGKGIATHLMLACELYCRENGIFRIDLNSVTTDWVQDFYKKCGYIPIKEENGFMQMYKMIDAKKEAKMLESAVDGRYMKANGKVYVESWPLGIDPNSVKAGDEVSLVVIPKEDKKDEEDTDID